MNRSLPFVHKGFTLIELLVVVAIIVILMALLVPGLSAAIDHAERTKCAANLGTIGRGVAMYGAEYKKTPQRGDDKGSPAGDGWDNGFRAGGGRQSQLETDDVVTEEVPAENRPLYHYASLDAFECPNDDIAFESRGSTYHSLYEARGSSYWMQPSADEPDMTTFYISYFIEGGYGPFSYFNGVIGRKPSSFKQPHKLIVLGDAPAWFAHYSFGGIAYSFHDKLGRQETPEGRLSAWNNVLFADGHAGYQHIGKGQTIEQMQDDFVNTEYTFTWNEYETQRKGSRGQ